MKYCQIEKYCKLLQDIKAENERLQEQIIRLSEKNGNLIIKANTSYNNYRDTQRRLDELCKANNTYRSALEEIKKIVDCANCEYESNDNCNPQQCSKIETKINSVIGAE